MAKVKSDDVGLWLFTASTTFAEIWVASPSATCASKAWKLSSTLEASCDLCGNLNVACVAGLAGAAFGDFGARLWVAGAILADVGTSLFVAKAPFNELGTTWRNVWWCLTLRFRSRRSMWWNFGRPPEHAVLYCILIQNALPRGFANSGFSFATSGSDHAPIVRQCNWRFITS